MELSDYAQALGAAQRLVPNWRQGDMQEAELAQARMQPQLMQAQIARSQAQTQQEAQKAQYEQQRRAAFSTGLSSLGGKPTPDKLYQLSAQFPEFATQIQGAAKGISAEDGAKVVRNLAPVQSLIQNGKYDLAAAEVKRHIDADKAAGIEPDEHDTELYGMLTSGDPDQAKSAGGIVYGLLAALNPDTAAANLAKVSADKNKVVSAGGALVDENGKELYRAAPAESSALQVPIYDGEGKRIGTQLVANGGKGGDPASGYATPGYGDGSRSDEGQGTPAGRTTGGWTPRARNGGDNTDAAVDGKIKGMTTALGINPNAPFPPGMTNMQIAQALSLSEGGKGSIADRQNNPTNLTDGRGNYRKFATKDAALAAAASQVARNRARGQNTIQTMVEGLPAGGRAAAQGANPPGYFGPQGGSAAGDDSTTGEAYLSSLPPGRRNLIQAINEGRQAAPRPGTRFGTQLSEDLARAYPGADATTFAAKLQTRKDFTGSGKAAVALASYNRFAAHLNSAWGIHQRLGGPNLGPLSGLAAGAIQSFSPKDVNAYNTEIDGIQGEFQKLTKLGVANEGEANRLIHAARAAQSSEGRAGALEAMASLVAGAYQPQVAQWHSAFPGKPLPVDVSPASKAVINNVIHGGSKALPMGNNGAPVGSARGFNGGGQQPARSSGGFRILSVRPK